MSTPQTVQSVSMQVLEALIKPKLTNNDRAKIIAEGFAQIEKNYLNFDTLATKSDIKETELKLTKETEAISLETKTLEAKLISEISQSSRTTIKWVTGLMLTMVIAIASLTTHAIKILATQSVYPVIFV